VTRGFTARGSAYPLVYPHFLDRILAGLKHRHDVAFAKRSHLAGPRSKRAFIGGSRLGFEGVTATPEDGCHLDGRGGLVGAICCQPTWTCETSLPAHMDWPKWARPGWPRCSKIFSRPERLGSANCAGTASGMICAGRASAHRPAAPAKPRRPPGGTAHGDQPDSRLGRRPWTASGTRSEPGCPTSPRRP
jgi:hypothetical protein